MRHRSHSHQFGRKQGPRKALLRGLVDSLVEHGRIKTTVPRAKEVRRHVERAITIGKAGDMAARRLLVSRFPNNNTVSTIVSKISKRFAERPGGYTRIIKIGARPGDRAEMAFLEFVDYKFKESKPNEVKGEVGLKKQMRAKSRLADKKKKKLRKLQGEARRVLRASKK